MTPELNTKILERAIRAVTNSATRKSMAKCDGEAACSGCQYVAAQIRTEYRRIQKKARRA